MPERKPRTTKQEQEEKKLRELNPDSDLPPDADAEERFNDFWKKNGPSIFGGIAIAAVIVCGYQFYQYMNVRNVEKMESAFLSAQDPAAKLSFASEYEDARLAGVALLEAGDAFYRENRFEEAAEKYREAIEVLTGTPLAARGRLAHAMSMAGVGQLDQALSELEAIAVDPSALDAVRAEAAYNIAVMNWERGNIEAVSDALDSIFALENAGVFQMRARQLQDRIPELNQAETPESAG